MKIKIDSFFKVMCIASLLMGLQFAPDFPVVPFSDVIRILLVLFFFLVALCSARYRVLYLSDSKIFLITVVFIFYIWALFTGGADGYYVVGSTRRATLAIGLTLIILLSFLFYRPNVNTVNSVLLWFLIIVTITSLSSLLLSYMGGAYIPTGTGQHYQSWRFLGFEFKHVVHFVGVFPRISGVTANPNSLGFYSGIGCILTISFYLLKQKGMLLLSPVFIINLLALLHTFSRSAMLALFVSFIFALFFTGRKRFLIIISLSTVFICFVFFMFGDIIFEYIASRSEQGLSGRDRIWAVAFKAFLANPIAGVGFGLEVENIMEPAGIPWTMHNAYLAVLAETGLVGFTLFILFAFFSLMVTLRQVIFFHHKEHLFVLVAIASIIIFIMIRSFFETALFRFTYINMIYIFLIGMAISVKNTDLNVNFQGGGVKK